MHMSSLGPLAGRLTRTAVLLAAMGCGGVRRGPAEPPVTIIFTNDTIDQATVYVVAAGADFRRIGTVIPGKTETLTVPSDFTNRGTVNIVARLLARSNVPQTGTVTISPGQRYEVRLQADGRVLTFLPAGS
ncbi:MAG TPA: hypothetical protein VM076_25600 [Gemmatimonadaceae bacterium]|nr:hypothetical protein [Gemmatimonadaceae bacterium]